MIEMEELEPCPFCGGKATSFSESQGWDSRGNSEYRAFAGCTNDRCGIGIELWHTGDDMCDERDDGEETASLLEDKAIAIWNNRVKRTCHRVRVGTYYGRPKLGCSECGYGLGDDRWYYCPNCGAKVVDDE